MKLFIIALFLFISGCVSLRTASEQEKVHKFTEPIQPNVSSQAFLNASRWIVDNFQSYKPVIEYRDSSMVLFVILQN